MKKNLKISKETIAGISVNIAGFTSKQMNSLKGGGIVPSEPIVAVAADGIVPADHGGAGLVGSAH